MKKTVIVLGAGASCDCEFPTGAGLIDEIIKFNGNWENVRTIKRIIWNSRHRILSKGLQNGLPAEASALLSSPDEKPFFEQKNELFRQWIELLPPFKSIDEFISLRPEYSLLAKVSIVLVLSKSEQSKFFDTGPDGINRIWYHNFFSNLVQGIRKIEVFNTRLKSIQIITFNYDRSLEYFLRRSISAYFRIPVDEVGALPILHVYGSIGSLANADPHNFHPYEPVKYSEKDDRFNTGLTSKRIYNSPVPHNLDDFQKFDQYVFQLSERIETYGIDYDPVKQQEIQASVRQAERVYFFGFAFHSQNISILFDEYSAGMKLGNHVDGTFYKIPKEYLQRIVSLCQKHFQSGPALNSPKEMKIKDFFEDYSLRL